MRVSRACKVWTVKAQAVPLNLRNETVRDRDSRLAPWASGLGPRAGLAAGRSDWVDVRSQGLGGLGHARLGCCAGPDDAWTAILLILWKHALVIVYVPVDLWSLPHGLRGLASPPQGSD